MSDTAKLKTMTARFAPVDLTVDVSALPANERQALARLVEAARVMDALFLRQVWAGNESMLLGLLNDDTPLGLARLHYFLTNKGPWSRLDHDEAFVPGAPVKPAGANFYPAGAAKAEVERWIEGLPPAERERATGFFTTIRRAPGGGFALVPYSQEYQGELERAAELLREAAALTAQPTLKAYLTTRADAFLTNDYYPSDLAWMALDSSIEPTIGPYEVYEDGWFNYKAAFEGYVTVRDDAETQKLAMLGDHLQDIEDHLPIDPQYRNPHLGALAPIRVVNEIFASGDGNRGVQTAAFNLPNDERIIREQGAKRVMLRNVQRAKFDVALVPISKVVLERADQPTVSFEAFFTHTVMHELMHGLGPHHLTVDGRKTTVRQELKDTYSAIEEGKADVSGLFALQHLVDRGVLSQSFERTMYTTFLASAFRSIRFGIHEAHGLGQVVQLNYLWDYGAFVLHPDGTFGVNAAKIREGVQVLTHDVMTLQAEGNVAKAHEMLKTLGVIRPPVRQLLDRLRDVPVDIAPRFTTADRLVNEDLGRAPAAPGGARD
ncbi:MAG TPA: hypothetical protein VND92_04120 [Vicinamibacterales bacterium]|nr:hypothetical protein [Vicinamibacterales bacterium]